MNDFFTYLSELHPYAAFILLGMIGYLGLLLGTFYLFKNGRGPGKTATTAIKLPSDPYMLAWLSDPHRVGQLAVFSLLQKNLLYVSQNLRGLYKSKHIKPDQLRKLPEMERWGMQRYFKRHHFQTSRNLIRTQAWQGKFEYQYASDINQLQQEGLALRRKNFGWDWRLSLIALLAAVPYFSLVVTQLAAGPHYIFLYLILGATFIYLIKMMPHIGSQTTAAGQRRIKAMWKQMQNYTPKTLSETQRLFALGGLPWLRRYNRDIAELIESGMQGKKKTSETESGITYNYHY